MAPLYSGGSKLVDEAKEAHGRHDALRRDLQPLPWRRPANESPHGREAETIYRQGRRTDEQRFVVTDFQPDQLVAARTLPPARDLQMRFTFQPDGGGTRLTDDWTLDTSLPRWLDRIGATRVSSAVRDNLAKLKELLETGRVRLQDGRAETVSG